MRLEKVFYYNIGEIYYISLFILIRQFFIKYTFCKQKYFYKNFPKNPYTNF